MTDQVFRIIMHCPATGQTWEQYKLAPDPETALQKFVRQKSVITRLIGENYFNFKVSRDRRR